MITKHSFATDRNFTYTYESRTLQKGLREMEAWVTYKYGREEFYSSIENRLEFEIGLGKRLQTSFYLNLNATSSTHHFLSPSLDPNGEVVWIDMTDIKTQFNLGFSNEWKYQLSDPFTNKIGSALYGEISLSPDELEFEGKLILDKRFYRLVTAFNVVGELEFENEVESGEEQTEWEHEYSLEFDYGLGYFVNDRWTVGFEVRNHNEILPEDGWEHSALFIGPNFSYKGENWWVSFTALPQIANLKGGELVLDEHEEINTRLLFSYEF
jgi:hypothetical protein